MESSLVLALKDAEEIITDDLYLLIDGIEGGCLYWCIHCKVWFNEERAVPGATDWLCPKCKRADLCSRWWEGLNQKALRVVPVD